MILRSETLREQTESVLSFDDNLRKLIKQMYKKMYKWRGIGLAANQVGLQYRPCINNSYFN